MDLIARVLLRGSIGGSREPLALVFADFHAASTNIIFLDACRNNPLARNLARAMGTRSAEIGWGLAPVESGVGTHQLFDSAR